MHVAGRILDVLQGRGSHRALEETDLGDIDQAFRGDDENVKLLIDPFDTGIKEAEKGIKRSEKDNAKVQGTVLVKRVIGKPKREKNGQRDRDQKQESHHDFDVNHGMFADNHEDSLVGPLVGKIDHDGKK